MIHVAELAALEQHIVTNFNIKIRCILPGGNEGENKLGEKGTTKRKKKRKGQNTHFDGSNMLRSKRFGDGIRVASITPLFGTGGTEGTGASGLTEAVKIGLVAANAGLAGEKTKNGVRRLQ